jgi:transposase
MATDSGEDGGADAVLCCLRLPTRQRAELERLAESADQRRALRARIVLALAAGRGDAQVARILGTSTRTVRRWRARFEAGGAAALEDRPRVGAPRRIGPDLVARVAERLASPPPGARPWSSRSLARATGLSQTTVTRILRMLKDSSPGRAGG